MAVSERGQVDDVIVLEGQRHQVGRVQIAQTFDAFDIVSVCIVGTGTQDQVVKATEANCDYFRQQGDFVIL